jgi:hypothetical protein
MLSRKDSGAFINLKRDTKDMEAAVEYTPPEYETLRIEDVDLPISEEDLDTEIEAVVKLTPTKIETETEDGTTNSCYYFEVKSIKFNI